jgi:hypothetical protein
MLADGVVLARVDDVVTRYLVPGHRVVAPGCWDRHDLFPLSLMIRGVLSPVPAVSVDR